MSKSRSQNSVRSSVAALCGQIIYYIVAFIGRTVFIDTLGKTYLGFSGLFSDLLALLSLAELGVGTAITYSMYKPSAAGDYRRVAALNSLNKKFYTIIGVSMTVIGLCFTPFLNILISDIPDIPELSTIYILYLLNTTSGFFFVYKTSILIIEQRNDIVTIIFIIVTLVQHILQIVMLLLFSNFIIYLIIQLCFTLINNLVISIYVSKHYLYIKEYKNERLDYESKSVIYKNVKAMFFSKISSAVVTSTDNILISKFVSTTVLGLYSNYTLFTGMVRTIVSKIFEALMGSVGNLVAVESKENVYRAFRRVWFINFWIVSFCCIMIFVLVNPFIKAWIGETYLLGQDIVFIVCLNLYMRLIRNTFISFEDAYGLFVQLRLKSIAEAIINLVASLVLLLPMKTGIFGVLLGTLISNLLTNFWYEPYLIFVKQFGIKWRSYLYLYLQYMILTLAMGTLCFMFCNCIYKVDGMMGVIIKGVSSFIIVNMTYLGVFHKTDEYTYFIEKIKAKFNRG